jgi:integrase
LNQLTKSGCNTLSNTVAGRGAAALANWRPDAFGLYTRAGGRKYLNHAERQRALAAMEFLEPGQALFALTLAWTGARVSEVLALTAASFQIDCGIVALHTLKRRKLAVREVPVPPELIAALDRHFGIAATQRDPLAADRRLWPWCRVTAWRIVKRAMHRSGINGPHACPKGFRHGFGVGTLQARVPLNLLQRWLGHARISTTAIYADACGPDELGFATQFWRQSEERLHASQKP